jgi:hypothetical protein
MTTTTDKLAHFLSTLNNPDRTKSVYVNPENVNQFRVGDDRLENGGLLDDWVWVGCLDDLSYGYQSKTDALKSIGKCFEYKGKTVRTNPDAIVELYYDEALDPDFASFLTESVNEIMEQWAIDEANVKVFEIMELLSENT